ncbi:cytoplasmic glycerophosphodiester phosphodiesterase [compost metagenome]
MSCKLFIVLLSLVFLSCKKGKDLYPETQIGGHACAGLHISSSNYHDNSLEAYKYARSFETIHMVEVDVQLSKDGTLWLFHDPELSEESTGNGFVPQSSDDYLSGLKYRSLEKEKLIRLEELPADLKGIILLLDLKESDGTAAGLIDSTQMLQALAKAKDYFSNGTLALVTNTGRFVSSIKGIGYGIYFNAVNAAHFQNYEQVSLMDGAVFRNSDIADSDVRTVKTLGKKAIIYDVRSAKGISSALEKSPDFLLTDDIKTTLIEKYK